MTQPIVVNYAANVVCNLGRENNDTMTGRGFFRGWFPSNAVFSLLCGILINSSEKVTESGFANAEAAQTGKVDDHSMISLSFVSPSHNQNGA
jgi:hypothetical protein